MSQFLTRTIVVRVGNNTSSGPESYRYAESCRSNNKLISHLWVTARLQMHGYATIEMGYLLKMNWGSGRKTLPHTPPSWMKETSFPNSETIWWCEPPINIRPYGKVEAFVDPLGGEDDVRFITISNCGASQLGRQKR